MLRATRSDISVLVLSLALAGGCHVYDKGELIAPVSQPGASQTMPDASMAAAENPMPTVDAASSQSVFDPDSCAAGACWWSVEQTGGCKSAGVPPETAGPDATDDGQDVGPIYLGLTHIRIGSTTLDGEVTGDAWQGFGLDLDGACTNSSSCPDRTELSCKSKTTTLPYDGELCRDNTFARLQPVVAAVPELGVTYGLSEKVFNCALWHGSYNEIIRITGYNGRSDDARVRLDFYRSTGIEEPEPWRCADELDTFSNRPRWRSSLSWRVIDADLAGSMVPGSGWPDSLLFDANAYVKHGYVVARAPDGTPFGLLSGEPGQRGFQFKQQRGHLMVRLQKAQDDTWAGHDGLLAGRIRNQDMIQSFRDIGFCEGGQLDSFYKTLLGYVDENADVLANGQSDPTLPCDAMSFGIAFEGAQIAPGKAVPAPKRFECCAPDKTEEQCSAVCGDGMVSGDETCDTAIASGQPGACASACAQLDACTPQRPAGSDCQVVCMAAPITDVGANDGCCPTGATAQTDNDCASVCGNGVVERGETCDPPGSCGACTTTNACRPKLASGSAAQCNLRCDADEITACVNGDGCCPAGCRRATDSDCSGTCGNRRIDAGETCEANTTTPCPTSCNDGQACTRDTVTGSAANCNVVCENTPITEPISGDGCCAGAANNNNDSDCTASCGNMIIEAGEQCDDANAAAGDGCANCQIESAEQTCLARAGVSDACTQCSCRKCTAQIKACQGAASAEDAKLCDDMVVCARASACGDPDCICGSNNILLCLAGATDGPCAKQVLAAARTTNLIDVQLRASDPAYPIGRANALGACVDSSCAMECGR